MKRATILATAGRVMMVAIAATAPLWAGKLAEWQIAALAAAICTAAILFMASGRQIAGRNWGVPEALLVLWLIASVISACYSVYVYDSILQLLLTAAGLTAFFVTRHAMAEPPWNRIGWWAVGTGAFIAALLGLREYTTNVFLFGADTWRAFGPFYNPNCLGGYLGIVLLIPVALALTAKSRDDADSPSHNAPDNHDGGSAAPPGRPRYREIIGIIMALVCGIALVVTGSKGAVLATFVAMVAFATFAGGRRTAAGRAVRWITVAAFIAAVIAVFTFPPIRGRVLNALSTQKHSVSFRIHTWRGTLDMIAARPLAGFGPGTFEQSYPRYARASFTRQAHQTPLQLAAEGGIATAGLLLAGIIAAIVAVYRALPDMSDRRRLVAAAGIAGCIALWVHNLVDYTWYVPAHNAIFWIILGLAYPLPSADTDTESRRGWLRWIKIAALAAVFVLSAVVLYSEVQLAAGKRLTRLGATDMARRRLSKVLPMDARRWVQLSRIAEHEGARDRPDALRKAANLRKKAVNVQPTDPTHYNAIGRIYRQLAKADPTALQKAERWLKRGLKVCPTSTEILANLGLLQNQLGKDTQALNTFHRLASLYDTPHRKARAIEYFIDENYAIAFMALAKHAGRQGKREKMAKLAEKAKKVASRWLKMHDRHRKLFELSGRVNPKEIDRMEALKREADRILLTSAQNQQ